MNAKLLTLLFLTFFCFSQDFQAHFNICLHDEMLHPGTHVAFSVISGMK